MLCLVVLFHFTKLQIFYNFLMTDIERAEVTAQLLRALLSRLCHAHRFELYLAETSLFTICSSSILKSIHGVETMGTYSEEGEERVVNIGKELYII